MKRLERIWSIINLAFHKENVNRGNDNMDMVFVDPMSTDIVIGITGGNESIHLSIPIFKLAIETCVLDAHTFKLVYTHGDMGAVYRTIFVKACNDYEDEVEVLMYERVKGEKDNQLIKYFITNISNVYLSIVK